MFTISQKLCHSQLSMCVLWSKVIRSLSIVIWQISMIFFGVDPHLNNIFSWPSNKKRIGPIPFLNPRVMLFTLGLSLCISFHIHLFGVALSCLTNPYFKDYIILFLLASPILREILYLFGVLLKHFNMV